MAKKKKLGTILPKDTYFYTITFEQGQQLTGETLAKHFPVPKGRKAFMGNHVEYKGFANGLVSVYVKAPNDSENMLYLHIGLTELDVACTCSMPDGKLCYHGFMGLHNLAWFRHLELDRYYWPGFTEDDKLKDKFFTTEVTKNYITLKPKDRYGNIFKSNIGFEEREKFSLINPAKTLTIAISGQNAIAYCLAYNFGGHLRAHLPVLMACIGLTSKSGDHLVSFNQFNHQKKRIKDVSYTANQQQLNKISLEQHDIAKRHYSVTDVGKNQEVQDLKNEMLTLWEQAIPLLLNEKYNYRYYTYLLRYLRNSKPRKTDMGGCKYSLERPVLSFLLKCHQDHFSLEAVVSVNGIALQFKHKSPLFIFDQATGLSYLISSVQDDDLLLWMLSYNNRLTVLKEHFNEFHNAFLSELSAFYSVHFIDPKTKKTASYNFEMVLDQLSK